MIENALHLIFLNAKTALNLSQLNAVIVISHLYLYLLPIYESKLGAEQEIRYMHCLDSFVITAGEIIRH